MIVNSSQGIALVMVTMVMVVLLSITGAALLFSILNLKTASNLKMIQRSKAALDMVQTLFDNKASLKVVAWKQSLGNQRKKGE